jgi:soluble lytic murein transglycosylase-like protein
MYAKSVHGRRQQLLRYAGKPRRALSVALFLAIVSVVSLQALLALRGTAPTVEPEAAAPALFSLPDSARTPGAEHGHAAAHAEESHYQALAEFLARKYRVSERMIFNLVGMAHAAGRQIGIDPLLIIAVMAVESRFNPIAESLAGAKGLMQVIPKYHADKLQNYGGEDAVFDPQVNILVGTQILKEYIARTGNLSIALQMYAGALNDSEDVYTTRVMNEKQRLQQVVNRPGSRDAPKGSGTRGESTRT